MKFQFERFDIDSTRFELRRAGVPVAIPRLVFDLILYLIQHRDRPVTKKELFEHVWLGRVVTEASLTQAMTAARRALDDTPITQRVIRTVHGRGYWWVAETGVTDSGGRGGRASEAVLVGRDRELGRLEALWERAANRSGGLALVVGDAGQGKTRLVEAFGESIHAAGNPVVWSFAQESRPTPPMSIWSQVASALEGGALIPRNHSVMQVLLEGDPSQEKRADNPSQARLALGAARTRTVESIVSALNSPRRSLLVVIEDLHRADTASLQALLAISSHLSMMRVMIVGTLRPPVFAGEESARQALVTLSSKSSVALLPLPPLSRDQIESLIGGAGEDRSRADLIWERSGGNPFFANLLIRLTGSGSFSSILKGGDIPTALASAIAARCDELPANLLATLRAASVLGQEFQGILVASLVRQRREDVVVCLDEAEQAGLVRSQGGGVYKFCHAILRDALYGQLGGGRRAELHCLAARGFEERGGPDSLDRLAEVAHHYAESDPVGNADRAVHLLSLCGDKALARLAPDDAATFFSRALEVGRKSRSIAEGLEIDLMRRVGESLVIAGKRKDGRSVLVDAAQRARARGDFVSVGRAALAVAPGLLSIETGEIDVALLDLLECAVAGSEQGSPLRTELLGRLALALYWTGDDHRRHSMVAELEAASKKLQQNDESLRANLYCLAASWSPESHEVRAERLRGLAGRGGRDAGALGSVLRVFAITTMLEGGNWAAARKQVTLLEAEVGQTKDPLAAWYPPMYRAMLALADGRVGDAETLVRTYTQVAQTLDDRNVEHCLAAQLGEACWLTGRLGLAVSGAEGLADRFPGMLEWRCVLAFFLSLSGRIDEAGARVCEVSRRTLPDLPRNVNFVLATCALAEAAVRARLISEAPRIRSALLPFALRSAVAGFGVVSWGSVARYVGQLDALLSAWPEAERSLSAALEHDLASGCTIPIVRSELAIAEMHALRGAPGDSAESTRWVTSALQRIAGRGLSQLESDAARIQASSTKRVV